jgi:hypothetical protein
MLGVGDSQAFRDGMHGTSVTKFTVLHGTYVLCKAPLCHFVLFAGVNCSRVPESGASPPNCAPSARCSWCIEGWTKQSPPSHCTLCPAKQIQTTRLPSGAMRLTASRHALDARQDCGCRSAAAGAPRTLRLGANDRWQPAARGNRISSALVKAIARTNLAGRSPAVSSRCWPSVWLSFTRPP